MRGVIDFTNVVKSCLPNLIALFGARVRRQKIQKVTKLFRAFVEHNHRFSGQKVWHSANVKEPFLRNPNLL
jgi:hypothetical protein